MTKDEAKKAYRQAWTAWCFTSNKEEKQKFEETMDSLQPFITPGPGPEWQEFIKTLPGFVEQWQQWYDELQKKILPD